MDFVRGIGDNPFVQSPRTSSPALHQHLSRLSLSIELHPEGSSDFHTVLRELITWYSDSGRASAARVCVVSGEDGPAREVLTEWIGRPLPEELEGDDLLFYAGDALYIAAHHSPKAPELIGFELDEAGLYLLRERGEHDPALPEDWAPSGFNSPDTEAALNGIFRIDGCTPAFAAHAPQCKTCLDALHTWDKEHGLPAGFEAFRITPPRPAPPAYSAKPVEGVGIVIPRPPEEPRKAAPWWKFWA